MTEHLQQAEAFVGEAMDHHRELRRCYDAADDRGMLDAHRRLGTCLRGAQRAFKAAAKAAMMDDIHASQSLQTSAGLSKGTSASAYTSFPRRQSRLAQLAAAGLPPRPTQPVLDGGAIGVYQLRNFELGQALKHIGGVTAAGGFARPPSRAEREERRRQLTRL